MATLNTQIHGAMAAASALKTALQSSCPELFRSGQNTEEAARVYFTGSQAGKLEWIIVESARLAQASARHFAGKSPWSSIDICSGLETFRVCPPERPISVSQVYTKCFLRKNGMSRADLVIISPQDCPSFFLAVSEGLYSPSVPWGISVPLPEECGLAITHLKTTVGGMHRPPYLATNYLNRLAGNHRLSPVMTRRASLDQALLKGAKQFGQSLFDTFSDHPGMSRFRGRKDPSRSIFEGYLSMERCFVMLQGLVACFPTPMNKADVAA